MASTTPGRSGSLRATGRGIAVSAATVAATGGPVTSAPSGGSIDDREMFSKPGSVPVEPLPR